MKKRLLTLSSTLQGGIRGGFLILALLATTSLWAYDFQSGDLYYNITSDSEPYTVEVTYQEWYSSNNYAGLTTSTIPETVTYNGTFYGVKSIGDSAFFGCSSLTSITIPNSVTSIGDWAFGLCSSLTSITIPNSVTSIGDDAFYYCSSLISVTIPNSVTSIGNGAFYECSSLTSITIPNSVTSIGEDTFGYCSSLISVAIPNSVTSIGVKAFSRCSSLTSVTIPNSVTSIGSGAFSYCSKLTSVTIPNGVTSIGGCTFENCFSLTSITIPNSVRSIGYRAFCQCLSLESITIPNSVTSIGDEAFYRCSSLTSITIPNSVRSIGDEAFCACSSLTSITIPNSVRSIGDEAFSMCYSIDTVYIKAIQPPLLGGLSFWDVSPFICYIPLGTLENYKASDWAEYVSQFVEIEYPVDPTCQITYASSNGKVVKPYKTDVFGANIVSNEYKDKIGTITFDGPVTSIGESAFENCFSLTSITIPNSVTSIGVNAFYYCDSLTSITIPNSVTSIGESAFRSCYKLTSIDIPSSVTSIGDYAFYNCSSLTSITCEAETPPTHGSSAFNRVSKSIPVYVPCGCVEAYKANSGWRYFTNIQEPLAEYSIIVSVNDTIMGNAAVVENTACGNMVSATPNFGYHFVQWSDGNTENPRTLELTQDTILTAEFAQTFSGRCGDDLYWSYDETAKIISITGSGKMYDYTADAQPWLLFKEQIKEVTTSSTATSIGESAFAGAIRLGDVYLGSNMVTIAKEAFAECSRLHHIYCYPTYPPFADQSSFANYNVYLHVPCDYQEEYDLDMVWGNFKYIECMGAEYEPVVPDTVIVTPGTTDVTITWPTDEKADSYSLVINKAGEPFCTLTFNADGQLLNIAFAPGRDGNHPVQYAEQAGNGYRFTVTGLEEGAHYTYNIDVRDAADKTIKSYTGEFTTESTTAVENTHSQSPTIDCQKILYKDHIYILRDGKTYTIMGAEIH